MPQDRREARLILPRGTLLREALELLWHSGDCSVWDVVDKLGAKLDLDLQYSTVSSTLDNLCNLGLATRVRTPGKKSKAFLYSASVSREQLEKTAIIGAVQTILAESGSTQQALQYLVELIKQADNRLLDDLKHQVEKKQLQLRSARQPQ
jgi:predicted transcriptional regulator